MPSAQGIASSIARSGGTLVCSARDTALAASITAPSSRVSSKARPPNATLRPGSALQEQLAHGRLTGGRLPAPWPWREWGWREDAHPRKPFGEQHRIDGGQQLPRRRVARQKRRVHLLPRGHPAAPVLASQTALEARPAIQTFRPSATAVPLMPSCPARLPLPARLRSYLEARVQASGARRRSPARDLSPAVGPRPASRSGVPGGCRRASGAHAVAFRPADSPRAERRAPARR